MLPEDGLVWCGIAKVGMTEMTGLISKRFKTSRIAEEALLLNTVDRVRANLDPSQRHLVRSAEELGAAARRSLCESNRTLSFTAVRNPWERLVSAYLGKIAPDYGANVEQHAIEQIRKSFGLRRWVPQRGRV